jgi:hypothetical protein
MINAYRSRVLTAGLNPCQIVHSVACLTTGPQPLQRRVLNTVWSSASSYNFTYRFFSFRSSISCLRLLPLLPVTSILPSICPSITCFRSQFYAICDQSSLPSYRTHNIPFLLTSVILLHFSHHRPNYSSPSCSSATLKTIPGTSTLLSSVQVSATYAVAQLVGSLRYRPEGRGFDSRWCHWNFSLT